MGGCKACRRGRQEPSGCCSWPPPSQAGLQNVKSVTSQKIAKSAFTPRKKWLNFYTDVSARSVTFCNSGGKEVGDKLWECGSCCIAGVALLWLLPFQKLSVRKIDFLQLLSYLCLRIISSPYLLLKRAALFSSYSEESIAKKRSLYADNNRSKGCLT